MVTVLMRVGWRDLWHLRGQVLASALVAACGMGALIATRGTFESLVEAQTRYYRTHHFADVFVQLRRAPETLVTRLQQIPSVAQVDTRVVADVPLDVPGMREPATARLVSLPSQDRPMLNALEILRGRKPQAGEQYAVVISDSLARAHHLDVGDQVQVVLNGRWQALTITGIALSPEYVYEVGPGMLLPDSRHFGVMWMLRGALGPVMDMDGAFNDVALLLAPGAVSQEVMAAVDEVLRPHGGLGAVTRDGQLSHRFLTDELGELGVVTTTIPTLFLLVAAFLLYVVLTRLVDTQRAQIGLLKSFGLTHLRVGLHYVQLGLSTFVIGTLLGWPLGWMLGKQFVSLYREYFRFPQLEFHLSANLGTFVVGALLGASLLGTVTAVWRAVQLAPAQAMHPAVPSVARISLSSIRRWAPWLPLSVTMMMRNLARNPWKAVFSMMGIACAVSLMLVGRFALDAAHYVLQRQFQWVHRDDLTVYFREPRALVAAQALGKTPGVLRAEGFRMVPVVLHHGHLSKRLELTGLAPGQDLRVLLDPPWRPVSLPEEGLVISCKLARLLRAEPGDALGVDVLEGRRLFWVWRLAKCIDDHVGLSAYVDMRALAVALQEDARLSGVALHIDKGRAQDLYGQLRRMPVIRGLAIRESMQESLRDMLNRSFLFFSAVVVMFASVIVAGVVYNSARIALTERGHELASLEVLGFSQREVCVLLLGEQALLLAMALPLGLACGVGLCALMVPSFDRELFRLPLHLGPWAFVYPVLAALAAAALSAWVVVRRVEGLDLVAVLKTRE